MDDSPTFLSMLPKYIKHTGTGNSKVKDTTSGRVLLVDQYAEASHPSIEATHSRVPAVVFPKADESKKRKDFGTVENEWKEPRYEPGVTSKHIIAL